MDTELEDTEMKSINVARNWRVQCHLRILEKHFYVKITIDYYIHSAPVKI
jgi:hypothetical protein